MGVSIAQVRYGLGCLKPLAQVGSEGVRRWGFSDMSWQVVPVLDRSGEEGEAAIVGGIGWDLVCQRVGVPGDPCCWGHVGRCRNCDSTMVNLVKHYNALVLSPCLQWGPLQMVQHVGDTSCIVVPVGDIPRCGPLHHLHFLDVLLHIWVPYRWCEL